MTVQELARPLALTTLCDAGADEKIVTGCYCGDLLSWVMSRAQRGDAWLTVMGNINAIGVAALADLACIVLTDGAVLDKPALEKARQNAVTVLSTDRNTYEIAAAISSLLPADA